MGSALAVGVGAAGADWARPLRAQAGSTPDLSYNAIQAEVTRIVKEMPTQPGPGSLLALSSTLRLFASIAAAQGADQQAMRASKRLIERRGRDAVIAHASAPAVAAHMRHTVERAGIPMPDQSIPRAAYERQLDTLVSHGGVVDQLRAAASSLEAAYAARQDRLPADNEHLVRIQDSRPPEYVFRCTHPSDQCAYFWSLAKLLCAMPDVFVPMCVGMGMSAGGYCFATHFYDCQGRND